MELKDLTEKFNEKHLKSFWSKVVKSDGCWLWIAARNEHGYGNFNSRPDISILTHRISWVLIYGNVPAGMHVLHKCDTPACVKPDHLFLGTQADNMLDMAKKGRSRATKLSVYQVERIRLMGELGATQKEIGVIFNVKPSTVGNIIRGERWKWLISNNQTV